MTPVSPKELARHRHTSAVAQRIALSEATIALDALAKKIGRENPGRRKGSVSVKGRALVMQIELCANTVSALRDAVDVPQIPSSPDVVDVHNRRALEVAVEHLVPGAYPSLAVSPSVPDERRLGCAS